VPWELLYGGRRSHPTFGTLPSGICQFPLIHFAQEGCSEQVASAVGRELWKDIHEMNIYEQSQSSF